MSSKKPGSIFDFPTKEQILARAEELNDWSYFTEEIENFRLLSDVEVTDEDFDEYSNGQNERISIEQALKEYGYEDDDAENLAFDYSELDEEGRKTFEFVSPSGALSHEAFAASDADYLNQAARRALDNLDYSNTDERNRIIAEVATAALRTEAVRKAFYERYGDSTSIILDLVRNDARPEDDTEGDE